MIVATWNVENLFRPGTEGGPSDERAYEAKLLTFGRGRFTPRDEGDARRLWNLAARILAERRFTRVFSGRRELIDHILVSHALVRRVERVDTATGPEGLPSVAEVPTERRDAPGSDHAPVVASFVLEQP